MRLMERVESGLLVPRGHGKVELFDERGKCTERVPFDNFLAADLLSYQKFMARKMFWAGMAGTAAPYETSSTTGTGASTTADSYAGDPHRPYYWRPGGVAADNEPYWPMTTLYCSDSSKAEAASEFLMPGNLVAWANQEPYTGVDTMRGTPSQAECAASKLLSKWVFEWPTTAGNGTIRSVGWARLDTTLAANAARAGVQWGLPSSTANSSGQAPRPNPHRLDYRASDDVVLYWGNHGIDGVGLYTVPHANSSTKLFAQPSGTNNPGAMCYDATGTPGVWLTHSTGAHLRKYSMAGAVLSSATRTSSPLPGAIRSLTFDGVDLWATTPADGLIYRISATTGEVLSSFDTGLGATLKGIAYIPSLAWLAVSVGDAGTGYLYTTAGVLQAKVNVTHIYPATLASQHDDICCYDGLNDDGNPDPCILGHELWANSTTIGNLSDTMGFRALMIRSLASRTLLPVDVIKDSTKGMKITYQFDFV